MKDSDLIALVQKVELQLDLVKTQHVKKRGDKQAIIELVEITQQLTQGVRKQEKLGLQCNMEFSWIP